jgi:hypothetical protein
MSEGRSAMQNLHAKLPEILEVRKLSEDLCDGIERLQRACYPYMAEHEIINADMARRQLEIFPSGQTVALDLTGGEKKVVGLSLVT